VFVSFQTIINHPDYRANRKYNDIALLRLESDVTLTIDLFPACLWTGSNDRVIRNVTAIGFGVTNTQSMKGNFNCRGFFLTFQFFFFSKTCVQGFAENETCYSSSVIMQSKLHKHPTITIVAKLCKHVWSISQLWITKIFYFRYKKAWSVRLIVKERMTHVMWVLWWSLKTD
jgi:hypothetical protein